MRIAAAVVVLLCVVTATFGYALGQTFPPPSPPVAFSQYGVVRVYAITAFNGIATLTITSRQSAPFFISSLTLFLSNSLAQQIVLNTVNVDGTGPIQIYSQQGQTQVIIVPAGLTYGDIVQSIPSYLSFLLVKDPLGNEAIVANGGSTAGIALGIRTVAGAAPSGATMIAVATVEAPTSTIVTLSFS